METVLKTENLTKEFPETTANKEINFQLKKGEIHSLLGENGAGKTTLMNMLYGIYLPTSGNIYINGKRVLIRSPLDAIRLGIGMIHQHFMLVETLTVLENIILGLKEYGILINKKAVLKKLSELEKLYGLAVNPTAKIWQIGVGEQQKVEIIKVLFRGANILILDEPTAVLTPQESQNLFKILNKMKSDGKSIIFITHKLEEVMQVSDRISILRRGRLIKTIDKKDTSKEELANLMVDESQTCEIFKRSSKTSEVILTIRNLEVLSDKGTKALNGIDLDVYKGEILGIAGVSGNGQKELVQTIAGLRKPIRGSIVFNGENIGKKSPYYIMKKGINYIPADRLAMGVAPNLSAIDNTILRRYRRFPFSKGGIMNYTKALAYTRMIAKAYKIKLDNPFSPIKLLSGGNMQKLILAREMLENPKLLIASYPTRGLDIASTQFFRSKLSEIANKGKTIILVSEDLDELLSLSDRIAVMFNGKIMGIVDASKTTKTQLGLLMAGEKA
ncbi:ABC transporter ATP-binding protein [Hippea sp. KM1]|uniref:ABC transporter ATP-binding protein n=1 Tax=Hippea sp. KM1 TaxID=944481 RepID=UPI00046CC287|nr:ABC transporter ATP-binding protein [Hippea sp. KM1]